MKKLTREQLLESALDRVEAKWPGTDRVKERVGMSGWSDRRLVTAYLPDETPESYYDDCAKLYGSDDIRYDSADEGGLAGGDPFA